LGFLGLFGSKKELPEANQAISLKLEAIGRTKHRLPLKLRGLCNQLDLYVQLRERGGAARLEAGGKTKSKMDLWKDSPTDVWRVRKYEPGEWEELIEPTLRLAAWVEAHSEIIEIYEPWFMGAVENFQKTKVLTLPTDEEIIIKCKKLIEASSEFHSLWSTTYVLCKQSGRYREAFDIAKKELDINPSEASAHFAVGTLCYGALIRNRDPLNLSSPAMFERMVPPELANTLKKTDPDLFTEDPNVPEPPTLTDLGLEKEEAMRLHEFHAKETIRLTKSSQIREEAKKQLHLASMLYRE